MVNPFKELSIFGYVIRIFYKRDEMLYQWHRDNEHREIFFFPFGKWLFQYDNELPKKISIGVKCFVFKGHYHRLIRKSGFLIALIKQY